MTTEPKTETERTHWKEILKTNFLGSHDLKGKEPTVTIAAVKAEEVFCPESGKNESRMVINFEKAKKPWICNKTNAETIEHVTGSAIIEDWVGKQITLTTKPVKAFGKVTDAIRVKRTGKAGNLNAVR